MGFQTEEHLVHDGALGRPHSAPSQFLECSTPEVQETSIHFNLRGLQL